MCEIFTKMDTTLHPSCNEQKNTENNLQNTVIVTHHTTCIEKPMTTSATVPSSKILKRCLSVPILPPTVLSLKSTSTMPTCAVNGIQEESKTSQTVVPRNIIGPPNYMTTKVECGIPVSNRSFREVSPISVYTPKARRYSASYSPVYATSNTITTNNSRYVTPRVSQLRQEECVDVNSREVNHEREVHSAIQISQSWEDLTLVAESWSCKWEDTSSPLQVVLPSVINTSSSSPSPNSNRGGIRYPYGLSPSPTRRTFATRRSMSPIAIRPSQLGTVKRKFELDDTNSSNSWNIYSQPPPKKKFIERGSSPVCHSSSMRLSPDPGTYDGRITPKLFVSKLCTNGTVNSSCLLPTSPCSNKIISDPSIPFLNIPTSLLNQCGSSSSLSGNGQVTTENNNDEGIVVSDNDAEKNRLQREFVDMQDETILLDDVKSETSSIGGCSNISIESSSCDSAIKNFVNSVLSDESCSSKCLPQKHFYINKQGVSGAKKFIVNHDKFSSVTGADNQQTNSFVSATKQKKID